MKLFCIAFTLFIPIQYIDCHLEWFTKDIPNIITKEISALKDGIVKDLRSLTKHNNINSEDETLMGPEYANFVNYVNTQPPIHHGSGEDPSIKMTTPQLIAFHGYICESHTIVTDDGYILTVHRIPHSQKATVSPRSTVLLHHGLLGSSVDWVVPGPGKSLAYVLSDAGYDVWLANVRGNIYSRSHITLSKNSFAFWNFSFHEVSQHDLPAVIDYIVCKKGSDVILHYIGHSMGTTILFALLSTKTQYNNIMAGGIALAPVVFMSDIKSPIRLLAKYSDKIEFLQKLLGDEFVPKNIVLDWLSDDACADNCDETILCKNSMFMLCATSRKELNQTLLPSILEHTPAGISSKTIIHYAQEIKSDGNFQQFDYGIRDNIKAYGTFGPPEYNLTKITLPIALFSSKNDWLAGEADVMNLKLKISNLIGHYIIPMNEFNHLDFLWAQFAPAYIFEIVLQILKEVEAPISFTVR